MARFVRVASISFSGVRQSTPSETVRRNLDEIKKLIKEAALDEPDIVCLPECSPMLGLSLQEMVRIAEKVPGPIFREVSLMAEEYGMYIILPMFEEKGGKIYNSAILIDRGGNYVGSYHKIYPTISEMEAGITPGVDPLTFKADFGILGFAICFDINFSDVIECSVKRGAELIFFPSMFPGGFLLRMRAIQYGVHIVSARAGEGSMIIDPLGRVLTISSDYSKVICRTINLDCKVLHLDYNYNKFKEIKRKYGSGVELDVIRPEAFFLLVSKLDGVTANDIIDEFKLETREEYYRRSKAIRKKHLENCSSTSRYT